MSAQRATRCLFAFGLFVLLLLPSLASAQQASGIAGVVKDTSGAVLPGVTVEAASPALIEKVRTVVTDGEGRYSIVDLRPGSYVVTFTLGGFSTVKREGIELPGGFTATVNADLRVGALEETVTVSGAAPLVDVQNVQQRNAASAALLGSLPTGLKMFSALMTLTAGVTPPPSGVTGTGSVGIYQGSRVYDGTLHGKVNSGIIRYDGMNIGGGLNSSNTGYFTNGYTAEEMTVETGGGSAESANVSMTFDMIPKEGGNTFRGLFFGLYASSGMQSDNLTPSLISRGLRAVGHIDRMYDANGTLGGPLKRDKLWFFTAHRRSGSKNFLPGVFFNSTHNTPFYTPILSQQGFTNDNFRSNALRLTWQASPKNKINVFADNNPSCTCPSIGTNVAAESLTPFGFSPQGLYQATWSSPVTNKLLFEAGASAMVFRYDNYFEEEFYSAPGRYPYSILNQQTGVRYNGRNSSTDTSIPRYAQRFSTSYITGSHAFKVGISIEEAMMQPRSRVDDPAVSVQFSGTRPVLIEQFAKPYFSEQWLKPDLGVYAQDQWTIKRMTIRAGLRFDWFRGYVPAQQAAAGPFVGARDFAEVTNVPNWKNINPRFGVSYDLFGTGRTALKASLGRYNGRSGVQANNLSFANNPMVTSVRNISRTWTDTNGDYVPDCNLTSPVLNGECGPISDTNFGKLNPKATTYSNDLLHGWKARDYSWDLSAEVQQQIGTGISLTGGYYRAALRNFSAIDNLDVVPADFTSYCVTAPTTTVNGFTLPGGGGYQVCGLADVSPAKFGRNTTLVTLASNYGEQTTNTDFFAVNFNGRLRSNIQVGGGLDTGRVVHEKCFAIDSPQELQNCRVVIPFKGNTQIKVFGSYPLPLDIVVSATLQNMPGPPIFANWAAPNAAVAPTLGRNLAACGTRSPCTATTLGIAQTLLGSTSPNGIPLIEPYSLYEGRRTQLNLRLTKLVKVGTTSFQGNVDVFNALNRSDILSINSTFGGAWQRPLAILEGRLIQLSGQFTF